jgi:oligoendopeptidase F
MTLLSAAEAAARPDPALGTLPEWNLGDLYPSMESEAFARDLRDALTACQAFTADYKGRLAALARDTADNGLIEAVRRYEAIDDTLGRIMSYAGLVYAGDTTDPTRAKFYGDTQDKITTASTDLLFFQLELNRIDDAVLDAAMAQGPLAHYRPWLDDIRKDKPHQLDDKLEQLFLEKSATGHSAWNRLFDETMAGLRFDVDGKALSLEPVLSLLQDPVAATRWPSV